MPEFININSVAEFENFIGSNEAVLIYFSHSECNVCKVLKPKVQEMIEKEFDKIKIAYCDTVLFPEIAAQRSIFAVPAILVFFDGREYIRKSRNIGIDELYSLIERPYNMMFSY
jgi:thioredoxin 1